MTLAEQAPLTGTTSIATRLRDRAAKTPDRVALREKDLGIWKDITWAEYWDNVQDVAHGLLALGVEPGDRVAVHSENRPEWVYSDLATVAIRAMTMGLYPTNPPAEVGYLLGDSGAKVLIAEDQEQVDKALEVKKDLPTLEKIVYIEPRGLRHEEDPSLMSWPELIALGKEHRAAYPDAVERALGAAQPDEVMTLIYTSGTTGPPKGAMLTIRNIEFAIARTRARRRVHVASTDRPGRPSLVPPTLSRRRADLHRVVQPGGRVHRQLCRIDRYRRAEPPRGSADDLPRRATHLGEDARGDTDPGSQRVAG